MTVPYHSQSEPNQEQHVEVVNQPGEYIQSSVVRNNAAEQRLLLSRVVQILWLLFGFLEALIGIRIVLKLIGANPGAFFTQMIYGITGLFLWPFTGIIANPGAGAFQLEISSILAMIIYALLAWGLSRLIWVIFYHPDTTAVSTYREERY